MLEIKPKIDYIKVIYVYLAFNEIKFCVKNNNKLYSCSNIKDTIKVSNLHKLPKICSGIYVDEYDNNLITYLEDNDIEFKIKENNGI